MATKIPIPRKLTKFIKCSSKSMVDGSERDEERNGEEESWKG